MEFAGLPLSPNWGLDQTEARVKIAALEQAVKAACGRGVDLDSPADVSTALFTDLALPPPPLPHQRRLGVSSVLLPTPRMCRLLAGPGSSATAACRRPGCCNLGLHKLSSLLVLLLARSVGAQHHPLCRKCPATAPQKHEGHDADIPEGELRHVGAPLQ